MFPGISSSKNKMEHGSSEQSVALGRKGKRRLASREMSEVSIRKKE